MGTSTSRGVRVAAVIVCAVFAAFVLIHLVWAVGVTWGLDEVSGGQGQNDAGIALTVSSLVAAAAGAAAIIVTIGRVGWRKTRLPGRMLQIGAWVVFAWPAIGALNAASTWGQRAVALPLAIAALVVARAQPRPRAGPVRPPRRRAVLGRGRRVLGDALRPGHRAALAAGVGCAAYGALKLYWVLGGELLIRQAPVPDVPSSTLTVLNWASVALAAIGIALALATVRERRLPWPLVVGLPAMIGALMLARAASGADGDIIVLSGAADGSAYIARWDLAVWSPFFAAWGAAWCLAALAARRRIARRAPAQRPPPAGARRLKAPPPCVDGSTPKPPQPPATSAPVAHRAVGGIVDQDSRHGFALRPRRASASLRPYIATPLPSSNKRPSAPSLSLSPSRRVAPGR